MVMAEGRRLAEGSFAAIAADAAVQDAYMGAAAMALMRAAGVVCGYGAADEILKGACLDVDAGELVAIVGPNGAGKSTLLKAIAGLLRLKSGEMLFDGRSIAPLPARERARRGVAFVPQEANVFPTLTVRENLEMGGFVAGSREPGADRGAARALSDARREAPGVGAHALGRAAAGAGDGDGADGAAAAAAAGRAFGRAVAESGGRAVRRRSPRSTARAPRSRWWSRTRRRR